MATLPKAAYDDNQIVTKVAPKYDGTGDARRIIGIIVDIMLLFDNCARVPVTILGADISKFPAAEVVHERNLKMDFLKAHFTDLVISFSGGDFGSIRYKGTASGIEFVNLLPASNTANPKI